eukprot:scaffold304091_cov33-Tisochrysis_lutea.AAC.3
MATHSSSKDPSAGRWFRSSEIFAPLSTAPRMKASHAATGCGPSSGVIPVTTAQHGQADAEPISRQTGMRESAPSAKACGGCTGGRGSRGEWACREMGCARGLLWLKCLWSNGQMGMAVGHRP